MRLAAWTAALASFGLTQCYANPVQVAPVTDVGPVGQGGQAGAALHTNPMGMGSGLISGPNLSDINPSLPGGIHTPNLRPDTGRVQTQTSELGVAQGLGLPRTFTGVTTQNAAPLNQTGVSPQQTTQTSPAAREKPYVPKRIPGLTPERNAGVDPRMHKEKQPAGVQKLDLAIQDLRKAQKQESEGLTSGAVAGKLDRMFDFSGSRAKGSLAGMAGADSGMNALVSESALPDPNVLGVNGALTKVRGLAEAADAASAPFLYQHAVDIAADKLSKGKAAAQIAGIVSAASKRAPEAVGELSRDALKSASMGRTTDALRYTKAVYGWNSLLSTPRESYVVNFPELKDAVKHVLAQALDSPGKNLPAPQVRFETVRGRSRPRIKALVAMPDGIQGQVEEVPELLAQSLALPQAVVAWEEVAAPAEAQLHDAFHLNPQAGFSRLYRSHRDAGRSALAGFWMAARQFIAAGARGLLQRIQAFFIRLLERLGLLSGFAEGTDVDTTSLDSLRSLKGRDLALPSGSDLGTAGSGLDYRVYVFAP